MRLTSLALAALGLCGVAANCEQCQTLAVPRRGNVDRVADLVLVSDAAGHTLAVASNPELGHLRVLDLTTERFVDAPNRFFPLSIAVGPETRRLATAPDDDSQVFALDASSDQIFVVSTLDDFTRTPEPVATGRAPGDLAAFRVSDETVELYVTLPDEATLQILTLEGGVGSEVARVHLGDGSQPTEVVVDPFGDTVVVADAAMPVVHIVDRAGRVLDRDLEVGGPISDLTTGIVDVGDGQAPVVLALRRDANVATAIRLFRPGFREDRVAILGSAEVPAFPLVGYVPDNRASATICCRDLGNDAIAAGEATDAWAAVATADGKVVYLALAAPGPAGRIVRLIDNDAEPTALGALAVDAWRPVAGDADRQPTAVLSSVAEEAIGDPPLAALLDVDEQLTLTWNGTPPGLGRVRVASFVGSAAGTGVLTTIADLEGRGARLGDIAIISIQDPAPDCPSEVEGPVTALSTDDAGSTLTFTLAADDSGCVETGGVLRVTIAVGDAFTVTDRDGDFLGRLAFAGPESVLPLPGAQVVVTPAAGGSPEARGSALVVSVDRNLEVVDLDLSDIDQALTSGGGGAGPAALVPVAIVGGEMDIPDIERTGLIRARRMVLGTGSSDNDGLNVVFACDEAETIPGFCDEFR